MTVDSLRALLTDLPRRTSATGSDHRFIDACEALTSLDRRLRRAPLSGFRDWLIVRTGASPKPDIRSLVLGSVLPAANVNELTVSEDQTAVEALIALVEAFLASGKPGERVSLDVLDWCAETPRVGNCLCCGYVTLSENSPGSDKICEICFWQDDVTDALVYESATGPNGASLKMARLNFLDFGASDERLFDFVRNPTERDQPRIPFEALDPATDLWLRTTFPRSAGDPLLAHINQRLASLCGYIECIVLPLYRGQNATAHVMDIGAKLQQLRDEMNALAVADAEPHRHSPDYPGYCEMLIAVWNMAKPRWTGEGWTSEA